MKTPVLPVQEGGQVVLSCQFSIDKETDKEINIRNTSFFKNGAETGTYSSFTSETATSMTIDYVTQADEGFYKCASTDREMQSPESWLAVRRYQGLLFGLHLSPSIIIIIIIFCISECGSLQDVMSFR